MVNQLAIRIGELSHEIDELKARARSTRGTPSTCTQLTKEKEIARIVTEQALWAAENISSDRIEPTQEEKEERERALADLRRRLPSLFETTPYPRVTAPSGLNKSI